MLPQKAADKEMFGRLEAKFKIPIEVLVLAITRLPPLNEIPTPVPSKPLCSRTLLSPVVMASPARGDSEETKRAGILEDFKSSLQALCQCALGITASRPGVRRRSRAANNL